MKKTYSPIRVKQISSYNPSTKSISVTIENRFLFSDLNESSFSWKCGNESGMLNPQGKSGKTVTLPILFKSQPTNGDELYLEVKDARGVIVDQYQFRIIPLVTITQIVQQGTPPIVEEDETKLVAKTKDHTLLFDKKSGTVTSINATNSPALINIAGLMVLPLTGEGHGTQMTGDNFKFEGFTACAKNRVYLKSEISVTPEHVKISVYDTYDEAFGSTTYILDQSSNLTIQYAYELKRNINPRQWGIVFELPTSFNSLNWERNGLWNYYPADHIGRLAGSANASNETKMTGPAGPDQLPAYAWSQDQNELGTNDFRSTKMNINHASLSNGQNSFEVLSNGYQHIRCWLENQKTNILVARYSNMGAEGFFRSHAQLIDKPLKQGDIISDTISIRLK